MRAVDLITRDVTTLAGGGPLGVYVGLAEDVGTTLTGVLNDYDDDLVQQLGGIASGFSIPSGCGYADGMDASFLYPQAVVAVSDFVYVADAFNSA